MKRLIFLSFLLVFFKACKKGEMVHIENTCPEFDTLVLADVFDVELIQGNQNSIAIEAYETFAKKVRWEVKNNTLSFYNDNKNYNNKNNINNNNNNNSNENNNDNNIDNNKKN